MRNILSGIRVVDAATYIAGPSAATVLADFGAEVVKVERPGGDAYRQLSGLPGQPSAGEDYCWTVDNRNRAVSRSISDSRTPVLSSSAWPHDTRKTRHWP